ncbi:MULTISPECIES: 3-phosphoshikimate 1-carboxyvinyltransferase [unclassified Ruminococcus]|uniref:3-phosphoshikimate 1-carboxyvinyltransferase n=1 Tax=unclassified Ruminococcus TaxID=2608920 RepID=UPI00210EFF29|nr:MULTISPECIES: 3-phosphoshikimate 1-carboxyvinyltransferase [unclassified Ruminococcus]MCQ4021562.1 3-phosphoshikimate 1-carboxyvinyltransferase [Ruminococcus sp. zg-924]MCQ4114007.1 3-phosphoshikimate 1-carboxyvinyltransferase [Ruminococcus sp. zg-921]
MSEVTLSPSRLVGKVTVPPSKSDVHRAIICAALSKGVSVISPVELSKDINATIGCAKALGAKITMDGNTVKVDGSEFLSVKSAHLDCCESGSTVRFFIPVAGAGGVSCEFTGQGKLPQRPIGIYLDCLPKNGVKCDTHGGLPLKISGKLQSGEYKLPGNISSQFITGLLFALPILDGDSKIILTSPLESSGYVDMTLKAMKCFGVEVKVEKQAYIIKGNQSYKPCRYTCEGDWSQAAFFMAAGALGGDITIKGLNAGSAQGDRECAEIFKRFGADVELSDSSVKVRQNKLHGIKIDARQIPDLVPALAVTAAFAEGETVIFGAERLRIKECDRLEAVCSGIKNLGGCAVQTEDGLIIKGKPTLCGGRCEGYNDHRIVMSMSIAALRCENDVTITDRESISKSYPDYFEDYKMLGGIINNIQR